ncbi:uncharacterized [Tachysurus ichikawai]
MAEGSCSQQRARESESERIVTDVTVSVDAGCLLASSPLLLHRPCVIVERKCVKRPLQTQHGHDRRAF